MSESSDRNLKPIMEMVGAVAVLLGLIFVGLEMRQNTAAVQAATYQDLIHASSDFLVDIGLDAEVNRIYIKGRQEPGALTPAEFGQYFMLQQAFWLRMQNAFMQWQRGTLVDQDWVVYLFVICDSANAPGAEAHWRMQGAIIPEFREFLESCDEAPSP